MSLEQETPVKIIQEEWEFERLLDIYFNERPQSVLEVGTYAGGTLYHWMVNVFQPVRFVSVDLFEEGQPDNRHLYESWLKPSCSVITIQGDSADPEVVAQTLKHAPFDWIFIDAGHREHEIRADVENYLPMVAPDGIVAFHDIIYYEELAGRIDVYKVWQELKREHRTLEISTPGAGGIGVLFT